ncbi:MAG: transglutaminaseTgpA domain-containing protein, partial [Micromonosporaceae bacterium]
TSSIPVEPAPDTVALPIVATWLAGTVSALLYARWPVTALLPPVALLGAAVVFVGPNAPPAYPLVAIVAVAAAAHLVVTDSPFSGRGGGGFGRDSGAALSAPPPVRRTERVRRVGAGLAATAVCGVLAVTVGPAAAAVYRTQPYDPRALFVPPQQRSEALNPLGMLSEWATDTDQPLLEVRTTRPVRTSWVALSRYDGITWLPDDEFRAVGAVLPAVDPAPDRSTRARQRITVRGLEGSWLPAAEVPRSVRGVRAGFDAGSGMLAAPDGLYDGLRYTVESEIPVRDPRYLVGAAPPAGEQYAPVLEVPPRLPEEFLELARKATGEGTAYQKALRLEKFLRTGYAFAATAPSGHGYVNLEHFLTAPEREGGGQGTSEQFATAFALLGRLVGLPTRVVVGFHAGKRTGEGRYLVRSGDAFAWAEVLLQGEGWVPFDPTPGRKGAKPPPEENTPEAEAESERKKQQLTKPDPNPPGDKDPEAAPEPASQADRALQVWLILAPVLGLLVVALVLVPVLRQRRTRSRLARGSPALRVLGAWAEVRDALRLAGRSLSPSATATELAADHSGDGLPDLVPLASQVNAVGFAAHLTDPVPDGAATLAREYVAALRRRLGPVRRLVWLLDPRPLFWRR